MRINSYCGSLPFFLIGILLAITLSITVSAYAVTQTTSQSASSQFGIMQIDQREYDVSDANSSNVKVSGTINNFNPTDANVTIVFTLPDGTTKSSEITTDSKGNFEATFPLDINSQKGTYTVYSSYAGTTIGALSFNVRQVSVLSSSLPTNPTQPSQTLSNNNITNSVQPVSNSNVQLASNTPSKLPPWIKHIFVWYGLGQISDNELLGAIQFLVENKIININENSQPSPTSSQPNLQTSSNPTIENQQNTNNQITPTASQQPVNSTQALFPQQTELGNEWMVGNLTLSTEQGGEWLEQWYQSYTNNYDNKKIHVEIDKYASSDKSQQTVNNAYSWLIGHIGVIAIIPDDSIKGYCRITDMPVGGTNGQLSTTFICQKDEYAILENPFANDNSDQVKQDMTKLAQIILNKMPNQASGQSQSNTISQPQTPSQSDLVQLFPTYNDGLTWSMSKEKDMSYNNGNETVDAYQREYIKSQDMESGVIDVSIYRFSSNDEAKQRADGFFSNVQSQTKVGFSTLGNLPNECQGIVEDFGLTERNGVFCNKNNYTIFISGLGSLNSLDDDAVNFANMILAKIS